MVYGLSSYCGLDLLFYERLIVILFIAALPPSVPFASLFFESLRCRKSAAREAWVLELCRFLHGTLELRLHALARPKTAADTDPHKGRHLSAPDLMVVAGDPAGLHVAGHAPGRRSYLRRAAENYRLQRSFWVWRRLFHHTRPGVAHLAADAARSGGKDSQLAVFYHAGAGVAAWGPPVAPTSGRRASAPTGSMRNREGPG